MTILELILAGLQTKFSGVDAAILTRVATKKAEGITDASQVPTILEGVGFTDVLNSYGDYRSGDASFKSVLNYEKKHNLKDGKPVEIEKPIEKPNEKPNPEQQPDIEKMIADAVSAAMGQKESRATRQSQILAKAKEYGVPETQAKRYAIPDDEDLDAYFKDVKQELKNDGFEGVRTPEAGDQQMEKESDAIAKMINDGTKTIVEQNKI